MPKGVYDRKPKDDDMTDAAEPAAMFPIVLNKNYVPRGPVEVIGYVRPEVKRKGAQGGWIVERPEEFVKGEMKPAPYPGVGFKNKIWAGTHIRLPIDEAKDLIGKKIAERADDIAA